MIFFGLVLLVSYFTLQPYAQEATQYAPVHNPHNPPIDPKIGYATVSFGGGAYMITEGVYQALFLVSTKGVILVDAPPTIGHKLFHAIGNTTQKPITHLVYSHSHADHIGAAGLLSPKVRKIAHVETAERLGALKDSSRPVPNITFKHRLDLHLGNQTLQLSYKGENHAPGNIFIYAPVQKVLMLVDVVFPGWVPFSRLGQAGYVPGYIKAHDQLLDFDFNFFVGGHLGRSGSRVDVILQKDYIHDLRQHCEHGIKLSATNDSTLDLANIASLEMGRNPGNTWALFKSYLDSVAKYCVNKTNQKWLGKLAGADVFGVDNALTMIESLRVDSGVLGPLGIA